jgi:hypothetical protein
MTGRGAGFCAGYPTPGYANPSVGAGFGAGYGRGMGQGRGRGHRNRFYATGLTGWQRGGRGYGVPAPTYFGAPFQPYVPTKEQEMEMLKEQSKYLEEQLTGIQKRLQEIDKETQSSNPV